MTASRSPSHPNGRSAPEEPFEAAIFDLDGLLVDSEPLWQRRELAVLGSLGVPVSLEMVESTKGRFVGEVVQHWFDRYRWPGPSVDEVVSMIVDELAVDFRRELRLKRGAVHAIEFARGLGLKLAVASSSPRRLIDVALRSQGLDGRFDAVHSAELEPFGKPDPAVFLTTAALLGVSPSRCVVFEDAPNGVRAAKAAGMACVAVTRDDGTSFGADIRLDSLDDLDGSSWQELYGGAVPTIYDIPIRTLAGEPSSLSPYRGKTLLIVNVASKCGLTPQYTGLQKLQDRYSGRGFTVLGFPCNQFLEQEPGSAEEIAEFCSTNYGVSFPLFEKIDVNGPDRHPIYEQLENFPDDKGEAGDVQWNFEKFLVSPNGELRARFRPQVEPEDAALVSDLEKSLPQS